MPPHETREGDGGGDVLVRLLAPLRVLEALKSLAVEEIRRQAGPLAELLPALERLEDRLGSRLASVQETVKALESEESYLNKAINDLRGELQTMHKTPRRAPG